jgi:hypothetical protein
LKNPFFDPFFSADVVRDSARSGIDGNRRRAHAGADSRTRIAMVTSAVTIILLTIVASLASWLFSQWLARRARVSGLALAVGGVGTVLLLGAVALVMVTASTSWQQLMPVADASPLRQEMLAPAEAIIPAAIVAEWPATDCVESMRADESAHWILENGCDRIVAVLFASCQLSETACISQGWQYEATGIS